MEANRELWNKRVAIHVKSEFYDVPSFRKGKTSLHETELKALGNVRGKSLLHLQCHFGMDTLSWAREGAQVTGVDFSQDAIGHARALAGELALQAEFICTDVYDLPAVLNGTFDIVFTSYGVIGWLPDLDKWASVISHFLKPGGIFFMAEFHPVLWMMDDDFTRLKYSYFNDAVIETVSQGTYGDREADLSDVEYGWNHSFAEILGSLLKSNLQITGFEEYPFSPYNCFNHTVKGDDGMYRIKGLEHKLPVTYTVKAIKNG
jgi:2-polyprenyl-3-methyl-5-hydroxy-6-metoxy-1,4-benzoquinol methylase